MGKIRKRSKVNKRKRMKAPKVKANGLDAVVHQNNFVVSSFDGSFMVIGESDERIKELDVEKMNENVVINVVEKDGDVLHQMIVVPESNEIWSDTWRVDMQELAYLLNYKPNSQVLLSADAKRLHKLIISKDFRADKKSLDLVRERMEHNEPIDPVFIDVVKTKEGWKVVDHEGRHRILVAEQLGYKVPLIVYVKDEHGRFMDVSRLSEDDLQELYHLRVLPQYER